MAAMTPPAGGSLPDQLAPIERELKRAGALRYADWRLLQQGAWRKVASRLRRRSAVAAWIALPVLALLLLSDVSELAGLPADAPPGERWFAVIDPLLPVGLIVAVILHRRRAVALARRLDELAAAG